MVFSGILTANLVIIAPVGGWMYLNQNIDLSTYILFLMTSPPRTCAVITTNICARRTSSTKTNLKTYQYDP